MAQYRYVDIERLKAKYADVFSIGEEIVIQVKLDGANASFTYNPDTDKIEAFSRRQKLSESNTLRGFYDLIMKLDKDLIKNLTQNGRYIIFGEYLVPHTIHYGEEMYNKFYMFDVYDTEIHQYLPYNQAYTIYGELVLDAHIFGLADKFNFVPVIYEGSFEGWEKTMEYLKVHKTSAEIEEGIVIKSQDRLDNKFSGTPAYLKIVNEQFSEVHDSKPKKIVSPEELAAREAEKQLIESIVTERRIEKFLEKMVDEGLIPEVYDEHQLGLIMKTIPKQIYEDCMKEESETVEKCKNFGKICGSLVRQYVLKKLQ